MDDYLLTIRKREEGLVPTLARSGLVTDIDPLMTNDSIADLLVRRRGIVFVPVADGPPLAGKYLDAVDVRLAGLGYVLSTPLRRKLSLLSLPELTALQKRIWSILAESAGGTHKHVPLFRNFPDEVTDDTFKLWVRKVLVHYVQAHDQPCLFCSGVGTTHVLEPCMHVVCDQCFDGDDYSACPVCETHVDPSSPFFTSWPEYKAFLPVTPIKFRQLSLETDLEGAARDLFASLCLRTQAMSPDDRADLVTLTRGASDRALAWTPSAIPVKENVALLFGTLLQCLPADQVIPPALPYLKTATDVLRLIAAYSNADPALQGEASWMKTDVLSPNRGISTLLGLFGVPAPPPQRVPARRQYLKKRFKVARLSRPLRHSLLQLLEGLDSELLVEDMQRHRSYWIWVGEFLHPHEHARRYPKVAEAFIILRRKAPDGTRAPVFRGYRSRLEASFKHRDVAHLVPLLTERPGEFARALDRALREYQSDPAGTQAILDAFSACLARFATPVLLTLSVHLRTRHESAFRRIYWPKGATAGGVSDKDQRPLLRRELIHDSVKLIEEELLNRFSRHGVIEGVLVDDALTGIMVPFNERTASRSAIMLPRGSRISVPEGKRLRLFLHWCQRRGDPQHSDLDLSVAFYDPGWKYLGVCSYYELKLQKEGITLAASAGDLRDAPFPDGASEFVDVDVEATKKAGIRYAVMVVNNYAGVPFAMLDRAYAGIMYRNPAEAIAQFPHFDPGSVQLKFALQGGNGIFLPLVLDLEHSMLHWLDVYARGELLFNSVATSNRDIQRICPELIRYFESGFRPDMRDLVLMHAAARSPEVWVRGEQMLRFTRGPSEGAHDFLVRLRSSEGAEAVQSIPGVTFSPGLAALLHGDMSLPEDARNYVVFPEKVTSTFAASDLLS